MCVQSAQDDNDEQFLAMAHATEWHSYLATTRWETSQRRGGRPARKRPPNGLVRRALLLKMQMDGSTDRRLELLLFLAILASGFDDVVSDVAGDDRVMRRFHDVDAAALGERAQFGGVAL